MYGVCVLGGGVVGGFRFHHPSSNFKGRVLSK